MKDYDDLHNPIYPDMPSLTIHRGKANEAGSIKNMSKEDIKAYADAIDKKIRSLNRIRCGKRNRR